MRIALKDFRAFQETGLIEIRPLTFLVGENSAGKTSLLAALNYLWRLRDRLGTPTFNSPPFDMGTFDEIVHRVRGRTKPSCFELIIEDTVTADVTRSRIYYPARGEKPPRLTDLGRMRLTFKDSVGDAVVSKLNFSFGDQELLVDFVETVKIVIKDAAGREIYRSRDDERELGFPGRVGRVEQLNISDLVFYLRRLIIDLDEPGQASSQEAMKAMAYMGSALDQLLLSFPNAIFASAPVRSNPSRVYTPIDQNRTPEGAHTPQRLFKIKESNEARWNKIKAGLERFGRQSGMFSAINVARYRSSGSSPFHINVTRRGKQSNIVDVGYGVSQALPILTDLIESSATSAFLFQQPEVHLHPQAQAALGSFFVDHISEKRRSLIVAETHSDYLIDRVRYAIKRKEIRPRDVSLLYFQTEGTATRIFQLEIDAEGNITHTPPGYREFFIREQMAMLGIED